MIKTIDNPSPGHVAALCPGCVHRGDDLSHPAPCGRVRWEGHRQVKPRLERGDDGVVACGDFEPAAPPPAGPLGDVEGWPYWPPPPARVESFANQNEADPQPGGRT